MYFFILLLLILPALRAVCLHGETCFSENSHEHAIYCCAIIHNAAKGNSYENLLCGPTRGLVNSFPTVVRFAVVRFPYLVSISVGRLSGSRSGSV